jgi:broad specificity phosphatase PhoE
MIELYLTRHGETVENASGVLQGRLPGHLNENGLEQARRLRDKLAHVRFDQIITSDLKRAVDTANIVNEPHGLSLVKCPLLRERDWGVFTGVKITDIKVRPADFPPSVENPEQLQRRARSFLQYLSDHFDGERVLAVGHGYFDRCIVAELNGTVPHDVPRWGNAEVRILKFDHLRQTGARAEDSEVSAD